MKDYSEYSSRALQIFLDIYITHGEWVRSFLIANELEKRGVL